MGSGLNLPGRVVARPAADVLRIALEMLVIDDPRDARHHAIIEHPTEDH